MATTNNNSSQKSSLKRSYNNCQTKVTTMLTINNCSHQEEKGLRKILSYNNNHQRTLQILMISSMIKIFLTNSLFKEASYKTCWLRLARELDTTVMSSLMNRLHYQQKSHKSVKEPYQYVEMSQNSTLINLLANSYKLLTGNLMS